MKSLFIGILILLLSNFCSAQDAVLESKSFMHFETKLVDFGLLKKGEKREASFEFVNTGKEDLKIDLVSACECTTTDYPRRPIKPGETGKIDIVFDSTEKEESETVDIDIFLQNINPETDAPYIEMLQFKFQLED